ncbi:hypothetical protein SI65_09894 [Aspergillus cristatus]|uniref:Zn(2)-C6 fungal-type domain-containing protein n=1 Tax=Aspergillus cristatus TaxID=573508 RepID=A0A1E3B196_ASPCR|nr:hypothetical protein SI65_09894 [Aspergillus cristatus]
MSEASTASSSPLVPRRHRGGLTRIAAACERCRRRKQKCDGRTPTCGACETAGASCIPSGRLVVHQSDSERDTLRSQLEHLQQQHNSLLQQFDQLRAEVPQRDSGSVSDVLSTGTLTMVPPVLQQHDRALNSDIPTLVVSCGLRSPGDQLSGTWIGVR